MVDLKYFIFCPVFKKQNNLFLGFDSYLQTSFFFLKATISQI